MAQQPRLHHDEAFGNASKKINFCECDHGDDLGFTFGFPFYNGHMTPDVKFSDDEKELSQKWMTYITNFAKTG